jgi:hypothetical protein
MTDIPISCTEDMELSGNVTKFELYSVYKICRVVFISW